LFFLASDIANENADSFATKVGETFGMFRYFEGWLSAYALGLVPTLFASFAYSRARDQQTAVVHRLLIAAFIGAVISFCVCVLTMFLLSGGQIELFALQLSLYAAGSGAISAFVCALVMETYTRSKQAS